MRTDENVLENNVWATSDLHFGHSNNIIYSNRPTTPEEQEDWIISQLSKFIKPGDIVYHMGDFAFGPLGKYTDIVRIMSKLPGDWNFIIGNHDKENQLKAASKGTRHNVIGSYHEKKIYGKTFIMFHYPIENWNKKHYGSIHLHGHIHNNKNKLDIKNRFNTCFDKNEAFIPYHFKSFIE